MNKLYIIIFFLILGGKPCFNQREVPPIKEITIDTVVNKLFSEFSLDLEGSIFKRSDTKFFIDSIILDDSLATEYIKTIFIQDFYNSNLIDVNIYPKKQLIAKSITDCFPSDSINICDDHFLKMNLFERNATLKNNKAMLIKYSKIYKLANEDIYFFSFHYFCGNLCGGQYCIRFEFDSSGNITNQKISYYEF